MARRSWPELSDAQRKMARRFSDESDMSVSQAAKYLDECFRLARGEIDEETFMKLTGHSPHTIRFKS